MQTDHPSLALPELVPAPSVLIVAAPFYRDIADGLIAGAQGVLAKSGARAEVIEVPGALEIPTAIRLASEARAFEGYIALGCVIRGETTHYETVCEESNRGLTLLGQDGVLVGNGILTCETMAQAEARANPAEMDKGGGAAAACLHLIALARRFRAPGRPDRAVPSEDEILLAGTAAAPVRTA